MIIISLEKALQFIEAQSKIKVSQKIGNNNLLMAYTHVAHDCVIGDNNVFANNAGLAGHVMRLETYVIMGGYSAVHQFCSLGDHSFARHEYLQLQWISLHFIKVASNPARIVGHKLCWHESEMNIPAMIQ